MNIQQLIEQATTDTGRLNLQLYTNLVLAEACRLIKEAPTTCAYTTFDLGIAQAQKTLCFKEVYNLITENLKNDFA